MNQEERELLKAELREEIMQELSSKSRKVAPAMQAICKKWFNGTDKNNKYANSKMSKVFGNNQYKVYEAIRCLVRLIFGKGNCSQLCNENQKEVEEVADEICELVYSLKVNQ